MPVTDLTGSDWNSPYRMPQGWTTLPDGSVGPSSSLPDWLKQLIPSPGAATPNAPGTQGLPGGGPGGGYVPGGGVMGLPTSTPGAPSMGFPAQGGPQVMGPQNSRIPNYKSVGPFTGGTSTEGSYWDPRNWFRANPSATFQQGQPMGPDVTGAGGFNPLSVLGGGNPAWRAAIAAGGVMSPTPADTGELPLSMSGARPMHPASTGAMPGFQGPPSRPYTPTPQYAPAIPPSRPTDTPTGTPSATPRPTPYPPKRPKNLGAAPSAPTAAVPTSNPRFGLYQPQVPGSGQGGPLSRSPIYTTLNLFGAKG